MKDLVNQQRKRFAGLRERVRRLQHIGEAVAKLNVGVESDSRNVGRWRRRHDVDQRPLGAWFEFVPGAIAPTATRFLALGEIYRSLVILTYTIRFWLSELAPLYADGVDEKMNMRVE